MAFFKNKYELGKVEIGFIILILLAVVVAGVVAWRIGDNKKDQINSFADCVAAGNPVMETYPEQCAADGQTFTNPDQQDEADSLGTPDIEDRETYATIEDAMVGYCSAQGDINPDAVKAVLAAAEGTDSYVQEGNFARVNITCIEGEPELKVFLTHRDEKWVVMGGTQKETIGCEELDGSGIPASITESCLDENGDSREVKPAESE